MKYFALLFSALLFVPSAVQADDCKKSEKKDIVDTAVAAKKFSTLVTAVKAAGLVDTLKGDGPFTVFAPLDSAFAKIPEEKIKELLKKENRKTLTSILTYHVVPGKVMAKDAIAAAGKNAKVKTVQGSKLRLSLKNGSVYIDNAKVVKTDIVCGNGVIHVIDSVVMPSK